MSTTYRHVLSLLSPRDRWRFALLIALLLAAGAADVVGVAVVIPLLALVADPSAVEGDGPLGRAYAMGGFETVEGFLGALCAAVFAVLLASLAVRLAASYLTARFTRGVVLNLSQSLLTKYLRNPYEWYLSRHSADLAKTLLSETKEVVNGSITPAMRMISDAIVCVAMVLFLMRLEPVGALVAAAIVGLSFWAVFSRVRALLERLGEDRRRANRERFQIAQEALGGIKEVKVMDLEEIYIGRFRDPSRRLAGTMAALQLVGEIPRYALEAIAFGGLLVFVYVLLMTGRGDPAEVLPVLGAFALAGLRLMPTVQALFRSAAQMRFHEGALAAIVGELREATGPAPPPSGGARLPLREALALQGVTYAYPGAAQPSLRGVDLAVPARTSCGIVGATGAGKTTLVDILLGLLAPQEGRLVVDGRPVGPGDLRRWQASVGYVQQHVHLVDDTIAANIAYGVAPGRVDRAAVERAARQAALHEFAAALPEGYGTMVGDRGVRLSGGQRQRIGIARALYRDPQVIVFDEATSALDTLTERAVMDAIGALGGVRTVIVVTHRLATVAACDQIVVMEGGRVEARGTYAELAAARGTFAELLGAAS